MKRFGFEFQTITCIGNSTDFTDSKVANKLRSSKIHDKIFVWYNEEVVKSGVRETEFLYESFHIVKNEGNGRFCLI